jgi:hypothetical protein
VRARLRRLLHYVPSSVGRADRFLERRSWLFFAIAALLVLLAGFIRVWAAPISAGPDVAQFWGFAKLFQIHGLDFYQHADGYDSILSTPGWGFVYPPIWLLFLRIALFASPGSLATSDMVDSSWRLAMKAPIIGADLAIGLILLWAIPGSRLRKLLFAAIWLFHPTGWYNSAVFGQFDAIAAVLLIASLAMFVQGRDRPGFILAGLAAMTKQHAALPALFMVAVVSRQLSFRRFITNCGIVAAIVVAISAPFILGGNLIPYLRAVLLPAQQPAYQLPLVFAFSGSGSILTFLHEALGWSTERFLVYNALVFVIATLAALVVCYVKRVRVEQATLVGLLLFVGIFYRVNYQYLVICIPLAIYCLAVAHDWLERSLTFSLILVPAVWVWLYDVTFWFRYLAPRVLETPPVLDRFGLNHYVPDVVYVILAGVLMSLCLAYVALILARRRPAATSGTA